MLHVCDNQTQDVKHISSVSFDFSVDFIWYFMNTNVCIYLFCGHYWNNLLIRTLLLLFVPNMHVGSLALCLPWPLLSTISAPQTHHNFTGQPVALLSYCLPSLQSWPQSPHCRTLFLFIKGGFPPLVLLLFVITSSFHWLTSSLLPVCVVDHWSSHGSFGKSFITKDKRL